ncbi:c-type cytochrome [Novosphingobium resinovorum]|uniref:Cytochrome C n=1 Tax=Novosphingobium resinovorum TaxID=158500 RepID=A0A031JQU6_9SPHN|nr:MULTISPECIES: c-type cytochrome [Sphingomonadaceae]AOR79327.1 cytochrome C [Novosphingobium resinovorum]EJU12030.1 class I cytochrome c [Sphingomonas sp. LH128]EZP76633.1 Class I cytochrome c [Novosphingobium resinovorum]MBF7013984.1 c-type cytochrome [Novosphingobium sp. HR1a]WJM26126.1 c-type cytochrome [Novosphingobium resinovorum]
MTLLRLAATSFVFLIGLGSTAVSADEGAVLFKQRCAACHSTEAGKKSGAGPNLSGIVGRNAGTGAYPYSPALKKVNVRWDARTLDSWLSGPSKMVPGTRMFTSVPVPDDRKAIVAYLSGLKAR